MLKKLFKPLLPEKIKRKQPILRYQFYVIRRDGCGYRINRACEPIFNTSEEEHYLRFISTTFDNAIKERARLLDLWHDKFKELPEEILIQTYLDI